MYSLRGLLWHAPPPHTLLPSSLLPSDTDSGFPPAHPRIGAAVAAQVEERAWSWQLNTTHLLATFPLPSCTHTSSMLGVVHS